MRIIEGTQQELIAFCQAVGRQTEEPVTLYQTPKTVLDYIEAAKTNTSIPPIRHPPKERTAMLEAIFVDYLAAGMDAKTIKEHLLSEHDISMTGHQICGWMGRMRQKGCQRPKDAAKAGLEGNCSSEGKEAAKITTEHPMSKELTLSQIKEIKRLYNKEHLRTIQIAEKMHVSVEQVEAIVWQVKG